MNKDELLKVDNFESENPEDEFSAKITKTSKQIIKLSKDKGKTKYSATRYSNGTIFETKTTKVK